MKKMRKQGFCDLGIHDDPRTDWDNDACEDFRAKQSSVVEWTACLKVCGNCEFFSVGEVT